LTVSSVYVSTLDEAVKEGNVFIPISASGYHPTAIVYVAEKGEIKYSVVFPAISPRAYVKEEELKPADLKW